MARVTCLLVPLALALLANTASGEDKPPTAAEVMGKLKEKRDSGGIQRYKLEFETTFFRDGQKETPGREVCELLIDWQTGKFRSGGWDGHRSEPYEVIEAFDGEKVKTQFRMVTKEGKPIGDGAWKYGMVTGRLRSGGFQAEWRPVFFHRGVICTTDSKDHFYPGHFVFDADADKFFVDGVVVRDGRKCIALKTWPQLAGNPASSMQYEYIIDPGKDHSVVGFTYYKQDKPYYGLDIDVGPAARPKRWAPRGWTFTVFDRKGGAEQVIKVKVTDFAEDVKVGKDNPFDIVPPEGATVGRSHHVVFRDARGEWEFKIIPYKYVVKNGKLVQTEGAALTPEMWAYDNRRQLARWVLVPAARLSAPWLRAGW